MNAFRDLEQIAEALKTNRERKKYNGTFTGLSRHANELLLWYLDPSYPTPRGFDSFLAMVLAYHCEDIPRAATDKDGTVRDGKCRARAQQLWEVQRQYVADLWRAAERQIGKSELQAVADLAATHSLHPSFARCFYRFIRAVRAIERGDNPDEILAKAEALHRQGAFTFLNNLRAWAANRDILFQQTARQIPADYRPDLDLDLNNLEPF